MSKKPKIEHEYHAGKDKLKITIHGYSLKSKNSRDAIVKNVMAEVERKPDRLIVEAQKKQQSRKQRKTLRGEQKDSKRIEVGD